MASRIRSAAVLFLLPAILAGGRSASAQTPADYRRIVQEKSPAYVTIRFTLKVKSAGKEAESQDEATGILIDPKGLILCSNARLGGIGAFYKSMGRDIATTPTDLKVLVGDDTEGLKARILTRDTELDLAWVQIQDVGRKTFPWIDLSDSAQVEVGEPFFILRRMSKVLDRIPAITRSHISAVTRKPRRLYVPATALSGEFGLPVFSLDGKVIGVPVLQKLNEEDQGTANDASTRAGIQELVSGLILPAADILAATKQARLAAASQADMDETEPASPGSPTLQPSVPPEEQGASAGPQEGE